MEQGVIYKIENLVNGKVYIGQTKVGFSKRIYGHVYSLKKNTHNNTKLQRAWNKYGEENFSFSIIENCDVNNLDELEVKWIAYYRSITDSYNLESGGNKYKTHCDETRRKLSEASRKTWSNPEYAIKMKKIRSETQSGKNNANAKKVICINTNEIFETMTEAANKYSLNVKNICQVCTGEKASTGYLQFAYYEESKTYKLKTLKNIHEKRRIICTNTKELFESTGLAAKKYGLSQGSIVQCCRGKIKSAGKLPNGEYSVWVYEEDYNPNKDYSFRRHKGAHNPRAKKIICLTTGEIFSTMTEAGEKYKIGGNGCKISLACTGKRKHVGTLSDGTKLRWAYYDEHLSS